MNTISSNQIPRLSSLQTTVETRPNLSASAWTQDVYEGLQNGSLVGSDSKRLKELSLAGCYQKASG